MLIYFELNKKHFTQKSYDAYHFSTDFFKTILHIVNDILYI